MLATVGKIWTQKNLILRGMHENPFNENRIPAMKTGSLQ
jgi:hypothetical protein